MIIAVLPSPPRPADASDLPRELSAYIDTAMARVARSAARSRPVVPTLHRATADASLVAPKARVRTLGRGDLALAGLLFAVVVGAWLSLLISVNAFRTDEDSAGFCAASPRSLLAGQAPGLKLCDRLPQAS